MRRLLPVPLLLLLGSCTNMTGNDELPPTTTAFKPVYAAIKFDAPVAMQPAKPTVNAGKIYAYGNYAFQVDQYTGIHIVANSRTTQAKKIGFLQVPFCTEIAIKNDYLYTNHNNDIVVFDLSNPAAPQLVKRLEDAFPAISITQEHPPFSNVYFECPDPSKGMVVDWVQQAVDKPQCRR